MTRALSLLYVTQGAPPAPFSSARRVAGLTKYLSRAGHRVTVLSSLAAGHGAVEGAARTVRTRDAHVSLLSWRRGHFEAVRDGTGVYDTGPSRLASYVVPDLSLIAWTPFAAARARQLARRERFDAVITSSPPESVHFVGAALQRYGIAWVADLRDGWTFETTHPEWAHPALGRVDELTERALLRRADLVTAVTDPITDDLRGRLKVDAVTLSNGFDPEERVAATKAEVGLPSERHVLLHTGRMTFSGRSPAPLIEGLRLLRSRNPDAGLRAHIAFAGPLSAQERALIEDPALQGATSALGSRSREETLRLQAAADTLVVITGRDRRSEATAKLYEYLATGKPILVLGDETAAASIVRETGAGLLTSATDPEAIASALERRISGEVNAAEADRERWSYSRLAANLAQQLEQVSSWSGTTAGRPARRDRVRAGSAEGSA